MGEIGFDRIAIAGLGLIGGSIALAIRERWPSIQVIGLDRGAVLAHVLGSGAIDRGAASLAEAGDVDLIVLAAPVRRNIELLGELARCTSAPRIITDVGGTKQEIVDASATLPPPAVFIGGHPLAGAERGGFGFARPDLFEGRPWIFTPAAGTPDGALERLMTLARGLGAHPSILPPDRHDHLMAFLSHLPQLTISALMVAVGRAASADGLQYAGAGLVDSTRLASSPAPVWQDVCATNSGAIGDALDLLIEQLQRLRADLPSGKALEQVFDEAARWRAELLKARK